mmetsp:Transcript_46180/g.70637  ORF Transcript_46180/g.70637 Transcript_46180/m.70637 type:complete len:109 (+) Transcript_46180:1101-1427(+)
MRGNQHQDLWFHSVSAPQCTPKHTTTFLKMISGPRLLTAFTARRMARKTPSAPSSAKTGKTFLPSNKMLFKHCLRVHLCLPDILRKNEVKERIWVEEDESIVLLHNKD